eukprot:9032085-Ditylum_brightwellii.AAC.2
MQDTGSSQVEHPDKEMQVFLVEEYFKLEQDMEKFSTTLTLTDEYIAEQENMEQESEKGNKNNSKMEDLMLTV